jgi:16S rRNA processing protein RimM
MIKDNDVYKIGRLGKPHGLNGELQMSFTDDIFDRIDADYLILCIDGIMVPFFIEEYRFRGNESLLIKFENIDNADKAHELMGTEVYFPREMNDATNVEEFTYQSLVGFQLIDSSDNKNIGEITAVDESTVNILFDVYTDNGNHILLPANEQLINNIDRENKKLTLTIPQGLLEI